jgi:hypothetical protein
VTPSGHSAHGLRPLVEAIQYRNRHVVDRFLERHALPREEADDLFVETLRWLWLCRRADADPRAPELFIDDCMALLDEMWHTFVLFTRDYTSYCDRYLGGYVHHEPTTVEEKARVVVERERDPDAFRAQREARMRALYEYVYDELGEDTLVKWYSIYPERYPARPAPGFQVTTAATPATATSTTTTTSNTNGGIG